MIIPDANLLLYASDSSCPFHRAATGWWSGCLSGNETVGLVPVVLLAFVRTGIESGLGYRQGCASSTRKVR